jgi:hypothetical protein
MASIESAKCEGRVLWNTQAFAAAGHVVRHGITPVEGEKR